MYKYIIYVIFFFQYVMGDYRWMTFKEVDNVSDHFGNALISLNQKHKQNIAIFAETRAEWMISVLGCFKQNIPGEFNMLINKNNNLFICE